jgi:DNA-binding NarL/FixJ family response regulator
LKDLIRILVVDDHVLFRDGIRALIEADPELELAGEAANGREAISAAEELQPDVVLMDVKMPDMDGIQATRTIVQTSPHIRSLTLTMLEDDHSIFAAMRAGAQGYLLKGASHEDMLRAIHAVANGQAIFSPSVAARMIDFFNAMGPTNTEGLFPELTSREREILSLVAQAYNNKRIAEELVISPKTVRNHISNILSKLQVADRAEAMIKAREAGL